MIKKIGILTGGESSEREISLKTCIAVENACKDLGYYTVQLLLDQGVNKLIQKLPGIDFVFIALHGGKGENGVIQGLLDSLNIPYNGSGVLASSLGMVKPLTKQLVRSHGIQTPDWKVITDVNEGKNYSPHDFPIVVKPSADGSTIGLSFVRNQTEIAKAVELADKYNGDIMIENYIEGRELTIAVVGQQTFPIIEIIPKHKFYDYECKYKSGMSEYICPAELPNTLTYKIQNIALKVFNILQCSVYARADFLLDSDNNPWFLEINTLPGMTSTSLVPKSAMAAGVSFNNLVQMIINESLKK